MSFTFPNSNRVRLPADEIWSRGGGSFRRLVWKEASEIVWLFGVFVVVALVVGVQAGIASERFDGRFAWWVFVFRMILVVFPAIIGSRVFARETEAGTWELLRSAGASVREVWGSKLLVTGMSTLAIVALPVFAFAIGQESRVSPRDLFAIPIEWLLLLWSMQCSLWCRRVWWAVAISGASLSAAILGLMKLFPTFHAMRWVYDSWISVSILSVVFVMSMTQLLQVEYRLGDQAAGSARRRWWKVFWRMVWKELLAARDFWLAVVVIVVLLDGIAWGVFREVPSRDTWIVAMSVLLPWLHSLGCGAIAFSIEREDGTQDWLRRISAPTGAVFAAKLLVSQLSIVSLTSLVLFGSRCFVSEGYRLTGEQGTALLLAVTLNGVIGLGASLLTRRVLPAMFLAFVGIIGIDWLILMLVLMTGFTQASEFEKLVSVLVWWQLIGIVLLATERWLADRWLNERSWWRRSNTGGSEKTVRPKRSVTLFEQSPSPALKAFGRLLWREWMEARGWWWALPIAFAPWLMPTVSESIRSSGHSDVWKNIAMFLLMPVLVIASCLLLTLPTLCGVWAFHHDQRHGLFRFLSDRGGSPTSIWLSKQLIWLPFVMVLAALAGALIGVEEMRPPFAWTFYVGFALIGALQGYAAGQWCSQLVRSPLISMFLASVLSVLFGFWSAVLWQVHAPWPYQFGAAAILFFASWVRSRDWLEERWTWRAWLRLSLAVLLPATTLMLTLEAQGYPVSKTIRDWSALR